MENRHLRNNTDKFFYPILLFPIKLLIPFM